MHNGFHPKINVNRLDLSRNEEDRGWIGVHDTVKRAVLESINYVRNSKERLLIAACTTEYDENRETSSEYKKKIKNERKTQCTQKLLHG